MGSIVAELFKPPASSDGRSSHAKRRRSDDGDGPSSICVENYASYDEFNNTHVSNCSSQS